MATHKAINAAPSDYDYVKSHIDEDRVTSIRGALSLVCDKAKAYDKLNDRVMNNDVEITED